MELRESFKNLFGDRVVASVRETAKVLGVSEQAVYDAIRRGEVPHIRIGTLIKVPVARLQQMLAGDK